MHMGLSEKQSQFSQSVARLIQYIYVCNYKCSLGEVYRTAEQAKIYADAGKGINNSLHCRRLALDLNLFSPEGKLLTDSRDYEKFGVYWEMMHPDNRWGGRFPKADGNHFEMMDR